MPSNALTLLKDVSVISTRLSFRRRFLEENGYRQGESDGSWVSLCLSVEFTILNLPTKGRKLNFHRKGAKTAEGSSFPLRERKA